MRLKLSLMAALLAVAGCANVTARGDPPKFSWVSDKTLDEAAECLVPAMNAAYSDIWGSPDITHHVQIISPGKVYEVLSQRSLVYGGGDIYYVRLEKTDAGTKVDLYAFEAWVDDLEPAVESCV